MPGPGPCCIVGAWQKGPGNSALPACPDKDRKGNEPVASLALTPDHDR